MVVLLSVVLLLVVADRGGAYLAGRAVAARLQDSAGLAARPTVTIDGFPFLTQAARGSYGQIQVRARDVPAGSTRLAELGATLRGVQLPLSDVVSGRVEQVPVERIDARVLLSYADLTRRSGDRALTVSQAGDRVRVRGSVRVLGRTLAASAVSAVTVEGDEVVVTAESFQVGNSVADAVVSRALRGRLDLRIAVGNLPYGLAVQDALVGADGVTVRAVSRDAVLAGVQVR